MGIYEAYGNKEISLKKHFKWAGREWYIPSAYIGEKGLVVDILMRVDATEFQAFTDKWGVTVENEYTFPREQREQMERENPLIFQFDADLNLNGIPMPTNESCGMVYVPSIPESHKEEQIKLIDYYNLDRNACWAMKRSTYL